MDNQEQTNSINPEEFNQNTDFSMTPPQAPKSPMDKPLNKLLVVVVLVLIIGGSMAAQQYWQKPNDNAGDEKIENSYSPVTPAPELDPTVEFSKNFLLTKTKLVIPEVKTQSVINSIPENLQIFLPANAIGVQYYEADYENGKTGYIIHGMVNANILIPIDAYVIRLISADSGWQYVTSRRNENFGFYEAQNPSYMVRVEVALIKDTQRQVEVKIISN